MTYLFYNLWSQILWGSADGGGIFFVLQDFREAEVSQLDVAQFVNDDVLGLQAASHHNYSR
jgi:hypothetical protein